tara:strand:- start:346 stop:558 length:213 start_codon:yes stop_codon:yes gene_type:complete
MDKFNFIVRKSDHEFVSIEKIEEFKEVGVSLDLYSVLTSDEATARVNFTLTNHLPSDTFEILILEAKKKL